MDDSNFIFSLYPNDLIKFEHKNSVKFAKVNKESSLAETFSSKSEFVYYKTSNITTGAIGIITNDNTYVVKGLGVKKLSNLEKYQVDVLGNYTKVKKEIRRSFR